MIVLTYTEYLQNSKKQSLALQSPLLVFHPILSLPPTLLGGTVKLTWPRPSSFIVGNTQPAFYICDWEALRLVLIFPTLQPSWVVRSGGRMAPLYNSTLNAHSKCLCIECWSSLPPRVNDWRAEMLFIFGRLGWLRSFLKRHVKSILSNIFCM